MRRLIIVFLTISLLYSSGSTIVACGVGDGEKIEINFENKPTKQTSNTDPLYDYVYNDYYKYDTNILYKPLNASMQLAADKIRIDRNALENTNSAAQDFYNSNSYKSGNYKSINYNTEKVVDKPFSYKDAKGAPLVFGLTDNDISKQQYFGYWYIFYDSSEKAQKPKATDETSIVVPKINDFITDKNKTITKKGWIHLFFIVKDSSKTFKIDFNIQLNVNFKLHVDKNKKEIVVIDETTVNKALGEVDFRHPENVIHERIANMIFSET
ncbi:hypothetical protein [Spiroplasma endosymbiont of Polydrusus pterygomalis]|uniref:hypothetical protein n=1 Tax=Spiroplasma endosymbiont of Polydrusus pterygomalis TaxID=3139327 RepID=UPI003CCB057D